MATVRRGTSVKDWRQTSESKIGQEASSLVTLFAVVGAFFLFVQFYVMGSWILSDNFRPVNPGPDQLPAVQKYGLIGLQIFGLGATLTMYWYFVLRVKLRTGRLSSDSFMVLALIFCSWQDPLFNYTQNHIIYNAHLLNMGSWTSGVIPGWMGENGRQFPEPMVTFGAWVFWLFGSVLIGSAILNKIKQRWPHFSNLKLAIYAFAAVCTLDWFCEYGALRIGWYTVPGAIRAISIHPGTQYQLPLSEVFLATFQQWGILMLRYFKDDRGLTFVERGVDRLTIPDGAKTLLRFLAMVAGLNLASLLYNIPVQWQATHSDAWPEGLPSYFTGTCPGYKTDPKSCGGPGRPMYRPDYIWLPH